MEMGEKMIIEGVEILVVKDNDIELYADGKIINKFKTYDFKEIHLNKIKHVDFETEQNETTIEFEKPIRCEAEPYNKIQTNEFNFITAPRLWCGLDKTLAQMDKEMSPDYERRGEY
jgi:hypothetical protein